LASKIIKFRLLKNDTLPAFFLSKKIIDKPAITFFFISQFTPVAETYNFTLQDKLALLRNLRPGNQQFMT